MSLFVSKGKEIEVFIKIWEKCPTWCSDCHYANTSEIFYWFDDLTLNINYWIKHTSEDFRFFLYWVDTIKYPHLEKLIKYINDKWRDILIQIDYNNLTDEYKDKLRELVTNNSKIELVISRVISSKKDAYNLLKSFKFFIKNKDLNVRYDLVIDYKKYRNLYDLLISKFCNIKENSLHDNYSFWISNIKWSISKRIFVNNKTKTIDNILYKDCVVKSFFKLREKSILLNDSIEIDKNWIFRIHTNLCFLWDLRISNAKYSEEKILSDFISFWEYINKKDNSNMWETCYKCINTLYTY